MKTNLPNRPWLTTYHSGLGCPVRGYQSIPTLAIVRAGPTTRYVFTDGGLREVSRALFCRFRRSQERQHSYRWANIARRFERQLGWEEA